MGDEDRGNYRSPQDRRQRPLTTAAVSTAKHPRKTGVHCFLFQKLAADDLVNSQLHLCVKPSILIEELVDSFHHQVPSAAPSTSGEAGKPCGLAFWKVQFHSEPSH